MLKELLDIKKELEPAMNDTNTKISIIAKEIILRKNEFEIYGPIIDRASIDNSITIKILGRGRELQVDNIEIKRGLNMVFTAENTPTINELKGKLKVAFEGLKDEYIQNIIRLCHRFKEIVAKTQSTLAKAAGDYNVAVTTNLNEIGSGMKFMVSIEYTKDGQKLSRENSKSAGTFKDTKTYINLVVDRHTESAMCDKLLNDVEKYFIGGGEL